MKNRMIRMKKKMITKMFEQSARDSLLVIWVGLLYYFQLLFLGNLGSLILSDFYLADWFLVDFSKNMNGIIKSVDLFLFNIMITVKKIRHFSLKRLPKSWQFGYPKSISMTYYLIFHDHCILFMRTIKFHRGAIMDFMKGSQRYNKNSMQILAIHSIYPQFSSITVCCWIIQILGCDPFLSMILDFPAYFGKKVS